MDIESTVQPRAGSSGVGQAQVYTPYGKACLNCVKSKTRCASSTSPGKCERCHRKSMKCQPAPSVRKKRISKMSTLSTSAKTAALEEKLEGIVEMLQRSQPSIPGTRQSQVDLGQIQNDGIEPPMGSITLPSNTIRDANSPCDGKTHASMGYGDFFAADDPSSMNDQSLDGIAQQCRLNSGSKLGREELIRCPVNGPTRVTSTEGNTTDGWEISVEYPLESDAELQEYLETYRTKMIPYFPIVCISATMTVEKMIKQRPFLFLVIRAICSKNLKRQAALVLHLKEFLGKEMLLEGTKNLDLLLGVLVFAAWRHVDTSSKPINSTIIQLAISLAFELGFTRPPSGEPVRILLNYTAQGCPKPINAMNVERTMEERRAAVGLYLISSVFANFFQRIELMRWTCYLDECLSLLEQKRDYPTDHLLVCLVRVQLICNKGSDLTWNEALGDTEVGVPIDVYVKTLQSQLNDLDRSLPQNLKSNVTLQLHIFNATLTIHEHSLSATSRNTSFDPSAQLHRVESLWVCLMAVKSWFNMFLCLESFPLSCYTHFSMATLTQMGHCIVALFRLATFEAANISWDRQRVRRELDLGSVIKLIVENFEQVAQAAGIEMEPLVGERRSGQLLERFWLCAARGFLVVKSCWEAKIAAMTAADAGREGGPGPEVHEAAAEFGVLESQKTDTLEIEAMNLDILDDTWIRDMLGSYDFNG